MRTDLAEIAVILDRSGSMDDVKTDVIGGFNAFVEEQKKVPGEARLSLIIFDYEYTEVYISKPLPEVPILTSNVYFPRGATALLDAIGRTINTVGSRLSAIPEEHRPGKVIVVIFTDGYENSSKEFHEKSKILEMITHQREKYQWEFIYLGANQDAIAEGSGLGIHHSINFQSNSQSVKLASATYSDSVRSLRIKN